MFNKAKTDDKGNYKWVFKKPWNSFTQDSKEALFNIVVSFKQNLRVINKTVNHYQKWQKTENGILEKVFVKQTQGDSWAIRKPMHTPMPYGKKNYQFDILKIAESIGKRDLIIDEIIKDKVHEIFAQFENKITATQNHLKKNPLTDNEGNPIIVAAFKTNTEKFRKRQPIAKLSNRGQGGIKTAEDAIKFINKVADFIVRKDLLNHLAENDNDIDKAFNPDGLDNFNSKRKIPVYKLPIAESGDKRFPLGERIGSKHKWMEAAEGTNLFFAIYTDTDGKRNYDTIPLNEVLEYQKQGAIDKKHPSLCSVPLINKADQNLLFHLSPNDLVYVPTDEEKENVSLINFKNLTSEQAKNVYKMVSSSGNQCFFIRSEVATSIVNKFEFSALNKTEKSIDGVMIKESCIKLKINRLGQITLIDSEN